MIIVMKRLAPKEQVNHVISSIQKIKGLQPVPLYGIERTVIAVIGDERTLDIQHLRSFPGVSDVMPVLKPYKLASRETKYENTVITLKKQNIKIGGEKLAIMAGPCSIENQEQVDKTAQAVKKAGAKILRGGAFKPRTGPYSFEGLGEKGLKIMKKAADKYDLAIVTEAMDVRHVKLVTEYADIVQIGARNMQNFNLLREVGKIKKPVLLKRGISSTIKEWLLAAEYILSSGNQNVILCERGIRTFEEEVRNTLGINSVPIIKELSHLPIIVDPSHSSGKRSLVPALCKAAIAAGADGILVEVHPCPEEALCDGDQSILPDTFQKLMKELKPIAEAVTRKI